MLSDFPLLRVSEFGPPPEDELAFLDRAAGPATAYPKQGNIRHQGEPPAFIYLLIDGWAASAVTLRSGERQIMKVHLPGDLMGASSICLKDAVDTLFALSPAVVRKLPTHKFAALFVHSPEFAARMFLGAQRERVALMDRLAAIGAKPALGRLASLLLDLHERLGQLGLVRDDEFLLRMTQDEIGDHLGLTSVHVNRTFRQLEEGGFISRRLQRVRLVDLRALKDLSGYVSRETDPDCTRLFQQAANEAR